MVCDAGDAMVKRKVHHEKNMDLKSVQGNLQKSVESMTKSGGGIRND